MHPEDLKAEIRKRGVSLSSLAKRHGVSLQTLSRALYSRSSASAERIIAEFIGVEPQQIWPTRYTPEGERLSALEMRKVAA